jgi:threonine 3-dehydrogenase
VENVRNTIAHIARKKCARAAHFLPQKHGASFRSRLAPRVVRSTTDCYRSVRRVKALVKESAASGFALKDVPDPSIRDDEVLIRVRRAGVCGTDVHIYDWDEWARGRCRPPFVVGHEFAGDVVRVGALVTDVKEGDRVTAEGHIVDGRCLLCRTGNAHVCPHTKIIGVDRDGCFADYIAMPATNVWHLDDAISYEVGGIHDPMGNAFHTALTADIPGSTVLVTGCGPIGIFAVGICKAAGASRIIATDVNETRLALARQMGAHDAVRPEEAERVVKRATDGLGVDVVLEMSGVPAAIHQAFALVRVGGKVQMLGIPAKPMDVNFATEVIFKGITIYGVVGRRMYDTWIQMRQFLRSGQFDPTPAITHRFPLEGYEEAMHVIKSGEAGKVVFEIA